MVGVSQPHSVTYRRNISRRDSRRVISGDPHRDRKRNKSSVIVAWGQLNVDFSSATNTSLIWFNSLAVVFPTFSVKYGRYIFAFVLSWDFLFWFYCFWVMLCTIGSKNITSHHWESSLVSTVCVLLVSNRRHFWKFCN